MCSCKCPCQDMEMQHGPDYTTTTIQSFYFLYIFTLHTVYFSTSIDERYSTFPASLLLEEQNVHTIATDISTLHILQYRDRLRRLAMYKVNVRRIFPCEPVCRIGDVPS
jgi:hypothetical protein